MRNLGCFSQITYSDGRLGMEMHKFEMKEKPVSETRKKPMNVIDGYESYSSREYHRRICVVIAYTLHVGLHVCTGCGDIFAA